MNAMKEKYNVQREHVTWLSKLVWSSDESQRERKAGGVLIYIAHRHRR